MLQVQVNSFTASLRVIGSSGLLLLLGVLSVCGSTITISFNDTALVRDSVFSLGEIASLTADSGTEIAAVQRTIAGKSAPPGFSRFFNAEEFCNGQLAVLFPTTIFMFQGQKRPCIRTDFQEVVLATYEPQIRSFLTSQVGWEAGSWNATITNSDEKVKCSTGALSVSFTDLCSRFPKGNSYCYMILHVGEVERRVPVKLSFVVNAMVVVAKRAFERGEAIDTNDCQVVEKNITRFGPTPYTSLKLMSGKRAARQIPQGALLHDRLVTAIPAVEKGDVVMIVLKKGRVKASVSGFAREKGCVGEKIWVENSQTHTLIRTQIEQKGEVSVLQGGV